MKPFYALLPVALCSTLLLGACTSSRPQAKTGCPSAYGLSTEERSPAKSGDGEEEGTGEQPAAEGGQANPDDGSNKETAAPIVPTAEQQAAAMKAISSGGEAPIPEPVADTGGTATTPLPPRGGLRMGGIAPVEDPASSSDAPAHGANQVEMRGLRSPKLPGKLPMDINGKLQEQN